MWLNAACAAVVLVVDLSVSILASKTGAMFVAQFRVVPVLCQVNKREYENGCAVFPLVSEVVDYIDRV